MGSMSEYVNKNGLLYSEDLKTVFGVDTSGEFNGRVPFGAHIFDEGAFSGSSCDSISLPESTEKVGPGLFQNCTNLRKVKLPTSLKKLSPYMFSGCKNLMTVTMPYEVDEFTEGLFQGCSKLEEIPFRAGIKILPKNSMEGCSSITSIVLPDSVEQIESRAFADCTSLQTVVLPDRIYAIATDAFEGCTSIHNVRLSSENKLLYVNPEDGCLYERNVLGDEDTLIIKVYRSENQGVGFYKDNVDNETDNFFTNEDIDEEDDMFSAEIGAADEELAAVGAPVSMMQSVKDSASETVNESMNQMEENKSMDNSQIDDLYRDIMNEEKKENTVADNVAISQSELNVLSATMDVMNSSSINSKGAQVSMEELENLFQANEAQEQSANKAENQKIEDVAALDSKTRILIDSAQFSKVLSFTPIDEVPADFDLFVVAERLVEDAEGRQQFSDKLIKCCNTFARIHDFRRVIMLYGLPVDNEEFMMFYSNFMNKRNIILACEAASPAMLSTYCKSICESSRINLNKEELNDQRKKAGIKNNSLIKLVIQDKYM